MTKLRGRTKAVFGMGVFALAATLAVPATAAAAGISKWVDAKGVTHYSNVAGDRPTAQKTSTASFITSPGSATHQRAIYKYKDARGITHYTDKKPGSNNRYVVVSFFCPACDPKSPVNWDTTKLNLTAYASEIATTAATYGVDPALVRAIIHAESAFRPDAKSRVGAQGLMQLMPGTAAMYGIVDAYDAKENISGGVQHLAMLMKKYNGDVKLAAAAYNAGEGAVQKYGGVPPYAETKVYVQRVGTLLRRYQEGLGGTGASAVTVASAAGATTPAVVGAAAAIAK